MFSVQPSYCTVLLLGVQRDRPPSVINGQTVLTTEWLQIWPAYLWWHWRLTLKLEGGVVPVSGSSHASRIRQTFPAGRRTSRFCFTILPRIISKHTPYIRRCYSTLLETLESIATSNIFHHNQFLYLVSICRIFLRSQSSSRPTKVCYRLIWRLIMLRVHPTKDWPCE